MTCFSTTETIHSAIQMPAVDMTTYDIILVNSSAGKDSQAMLDLVVRRAIELGIKDRVIVVHADLGRVEWAGTKELAEEQAKMYGVRFEVVTRPQGDLLQYALERKKWPASNARWCTSDLKRSQIFRVMTKLVKELKHPAGSPVRILNCLGIRAAESPARSKKTPFERLLKATNGLRTVDQWYPIFDWSVEQVWSTIKASGVPSHRAYTLGMPRLSCVFCVFAPENALLLAGKHNRALLRQYVEVEQQIGHTFRKNFPIASIEAKLDAGVEPGMITTWEM